MVKLEMKRFTFYLDILMIGLDEIGCSRNPAHLNQAVIKVSEQVIDEDEPLPEHD